MVVNSASRVTFVCLHQTCRLDGFVFADILDLLACCCVAFVAVSTAHKEINMQQVLLQ